MKKYRIFTYFFLLLSAGYSAVAQSEYAKLRAYDDLLEEAQSTDKLVFFLAHQRSARFSPYDSLFLSMKARNMLRYEFASGMVRIAPEDINHPVVKAFNLRSPAYFITDKEGYPLLRYNKPIKREETLLKLIDSAKTIAQGETMGKLHAQYKKGFRSPALLRKLLEQYQAFDAYTDQQVLNDYIAQMRIQDLGNFETVVFLLRCGPFYNSFAHRLAYTNRGMVDSLYRSLPLSERRAINNRMNRQTFRQALDKQDFAMASSLGNTVANTWQTHHLRAGMSRSYYPMRYLWAMNDTTAYLSRARIYYDTFFYKLDQDSLAKLDYAYGRGMKILYRGFELDSAENISLKKWLTKSRPRYIKTQVDNLNYAANQLLRYGKNNPEILFDGIRWMRKSIELLPDCGQSYYILAKMLYEVGFHDEALAKQQRAVALYKPQKKCYARMQDVLKLMQEHLWVGD